MTPTLSGPPRQAPPSGEAHLLPILGDQLSHDLVTLRRGDPARDIVLMAEVADETRYVPHHKKKIAFVLAAMRHFAAELTARGWRVDYVRLDDRANSGSLDGEIERALARHRIARLRLCQPGEWRVARLLQAMAARIDRPVDWFEDERFLCSREAFAAWAAGRKSLRMEHFYRFMRRRTGLLMEGDAPAGGRWNFDAENRKPPGKGLRPPSPPRFPPSARTAAVLALVERRFAAHFGSLRPFALAVDAAGAERLLEHFLQRALPSFGDYQDAMLDGEPFLFHSLIAPCLNVGLLDPLDVCRRAERAWREGRAPLNAVEGFIRQILGWREFVRGLYWHAGPDYGARNALGHDRALPDFYWTGDTNMHCLARCIAQTRDQAYAHHIQRLMVTGNFALLAGLSPQAVHEWYLAVYADAFEWVELPNTLGMSQFADGGLLASKPYAAGGNYLNRMSDYCRHCRYDVKQPSGEEACPFNYLYWDFMARHRERLSGNPRLALVYRGWDRMASQRQAAIRASAAAFLSALERGTLPGRSRLI